MSTNCAECGTLNSEGANYCQNCGALLPRPESDGGEPGTATYRVGETGELIPVEVDEIVAGGAALIIRSGGGRAGESFPLEKDHMTIGRGPDADVFLDDVTVSRDHAIIVRRGSEFHLDDCGSLNGTYVNRVRIDSHRLDDDDELQVGKYKLTFLQR